MAVAYRHDVFLDRDDWPRQINSKRLIDQGMSTVTALLRLAGPAAMGRIMNFKI